MIRLSGIYMISNNINGKVYIGQSVDIKKRWREHRSAAFNLNSKDYDMVIYRAIRKYGLDNFNFTIIEKCRVEELNNREKYWILFYDSKTNGYNVSLGGNDYTHLGNIVELYDYSGKYICECSNAMEVSNKLGVFYGTVYQVLYGKRLSVKGYQLKIKGDNKQIGKYVSRQGGKLRVCNLNDNDEKIAEFESIADAARILNLDSSCITKCCKGKLIHHGGFKWKYLDEVI